MTPSTIGLIVLACVFGGALLGMTLRRVIPERHLTADSKDVIKLAMGLTATMSALVLALLIASAKSSYDAQKNEITHFATNIVLLDRTLAMYGPEAGDVRRLMRVAISRMIEQIWPDQSAGALSVDPTAIGGATIYSKIELLNPQNQVQRSLQTEALHLGLELGETRWLMFEQRGSSIPMPFLILLIFWVTVIFLSFGLFAPANPTVVATLLLCAVSVAGAIFLILELDRPFEGLIQISSAPMRDALNHLNR